MQGSLSTRPEDPPPSEIPKESFEIPVSHLFNPHHLAAVQKTTQIRVDAIEADLEQTDGFPTRKAYQKSVRAGNKRIRNEDLPNFEKNALFHMLYGRDGLMPLNEYLVTCADGRVDGKTPFSKDPLDRFCTTWRPSAGVIFSSKLWDICRSKNPAELLTELLNDEKQKKILFEEMDVLFKRGIGNLRRKSKAATLAARKLLCNENFPQNQNPETANLIELAERFIELSADSISNSVEWSKLAHRPETEYGQFKEKIEKLTEPFATVIELQSHSHLGCDNGNHGCGAHGSNDVQALQMTAINALVLESWVKDRFPDENIHVVRTHHLTGSDERVVSAATPHYMSGIDPKLKALMRDETASEGFGKEMIRFRPLFYADGPSTDDMLVHHDVPHHVVRRRNIKINSNVDTEKHDEYIVRVSQYHKANGLQNTSVLEQSITSETDLNVGLAKRLIAIAQKNRVDRDRKNGVLQPIFLHLDAPVANNEENAKKAQLYQDMFDTLENDKMIKTLCESGDLIIIRSVTSGHFFRKKSGVRSLRMSFLEDNRGFVCTPAEKSEIEANEDRWESLKRTKYY